MYPGKINILIQNNLDLLNHPVIHLPVLSIIFTFVPITQKPNMLLMLLRVSLVQILTDQVHDITSLSLL